MRPRGCESLLVRGRPWEVITLDSDDEAEKEKFEEYNAQHKVPKRALKKSKKKWSLLLEEDTKPDTIWNRLMSEAIPMSSECCFYYNTTEWKVVKEDENGVKLEKPYPKTTTVPVKCEGPWARPTPVITKMPHTLLYVGGAGSMTIDELPYTFVSGEKKYFLRGCLLCDMTHFTCIMAEWINQNFDSIR